MTNPWEKKSPVIGHQHTEAINTEVAEANLECSNQYVQQLEAQFEERDEDTSQLTIAGHSHDVLNKVMEWYHINEQITALKAKEMVLRKELANHYFPDPTEGTNTQEMPDDWKLKATFKYNRNIDKAALPAVLEKLPEGTEDKVIDYKPSLKLRAYKALTETHKEIFDEALVIKPGTPTLELVPPKEKK